MTVCGRDRRPRLQLEPRGTVSKLALPALAERLWLSRLHRSRFFRPVPEGLRENLRNEMKRTERIALLLRTRDGVAASELKRFGQETSEFRALGLLRKSNDNFVLTRKGKELADSVAEAFL